MLPRYCKRPRARMTVQLDPVIAQIIPLLPLRDPNSMTPQSAREQLRALTAARAAVPPPVVASVADRQLKGAAGPPAPPVFPPLPQKTPTLGIFPVGRCGARETGNPYPHTALVAS